MDGWRSTSYAVVLAAAFAAPGPVRAAIVTTTGAVMEIPAPPSVVRDQIESNERIWLFAEAAGVRLDQKLATDISLPGVYSLKEELSPAFIGRGVVNSYFLLLDDEEGSGVNPLLSGSVTFSDPILGIMIQADTLDASDELLGSVSTAYPIGSVRRGLELPDDVVTLSDDLRTVRLDLHLIAFVDSVRIVTAPDPSTGWMLMVAILAISRRGRSITAPGGGRNQADASPSGDACSAMAERNTSP